MIQTLRIDIDSGEKQRASRVTMSHLKTDLSGPVDGSVLRETPNYHSNVLVAQRSAAGS